MSILKDEFDPKQVIERELRRLCEKHPEQVSMYYYTRWSGWFVERLVEKLQQSGMSRQAAEASVNDRRTWIFFFFYRSRLHFTGVRTLSKQEAERMRAALLRNPAVQAAIRNVAARKAE